MALRVRDDTGPSSARAGGTGQVTHLSRPRMKPSPILSQGPKQTWTSLTMRSRRLRSTTSSLTRFWQCKGLERPMCEHGGAARERLPPGTAAARRESWQPPCQLPSRPPPRRGCFCRLYFCSGSPGLRPRFPPRRPVGLRSRQRPRAWRRAFLSLSSSSSLSSSPLLL